MRCDERVCQGETQCTACVSLASRLTHTSSLTLIPPLLTHSPTQWHSLTRLLPVAHWLPLERLLAVAEPALAVEALVDVRSVHHPPGLQEEEVLLGEGSCTHARTHARTHTHTHTHDERGSEVQRRREGKRREGGGEGEWRGGWRQGDGREGGER